MKASNTFPLLLLAFAAALWSPASPASVPRAAVENSGPIQAAAAALDDATPGEAIPDSESNAAPRLSGSLATIVTETVRRSASSTVDAVGRVGSAVAGGARKTVNGTVNAASRMGGALADTVMNTATDTVRLAGNVTHAALDTAGDTVNGAIRIADALGTIVAGTVSDAARSLITVPKNVLEYATSLIGTPYKWGGTSVSTGMDCSGFVQQVVKASTGKELPRTAREMSLEGDRIEKSQLQPGDLVFFNTRRRPFSHVGIYLGDGEFVHGASGRKSGKQVRIDKLSNAYYTKRYNGARRVAEVSGALDPMDAAGREIN